MRTPFKSAPPPSDLRGSKGFWLSAYFLCSLSLTIYNKAIMQLLHFPLPCFVTSVHTLFGWIGCYCLAYFGVFTPITLGREQARTVLYFSLLYTVNIGVSNMSLNLVTVPVHQVARAIIPAITMFLSKILFNESYSTLTYLSLVPVITGVPMATFGDYYFSTLGFICTLFGVVLASIKTIVTNKVQVGKYKLPPLDLLYHMSPLAFAQTFIWAFVFGEHNTFIDYLQQGKFTQNVTGTTFVLAIIGNGVLAFLLNFVSFTANGVTSPLMMGIAGNMKQVLSVIISIFVFHLTVTKMNALGILLTLFGGALYTYVELNRKNGAVYSPASNSTSLNFNARWRKAVLVVVFMVILYLGFDGLADTELRYPTSSIAVVPFSPKPIISPSTTTNAALPKVSQSASNSNQRSASANKTLLATSTRVSTTESSSKTAVPKTSRLDRVCVAKRYFKDVCPSEIEIHGETTENIPKIIWTYWGGSGKTEEEIEAQLPDFVSKCVNGWKAYNPDYVVSVVSTNTAKDYISQTEFPANFTSFSGKIQANWFRLAVLKEHGGIWLDASIILTQSLSFVHEYQQKYSSEGFMYYLDYFTSKREYPIYETWFIASVPNSKFISEWLLEYTVPLVGNLLGEPYLKTLKNEYGVDTYKEWIQKINIAYYLNLHVTLQKILHLQKAPRFYSVAAECGPYYIKDCSGWWDPTAIANALLTKWTGPVPRVIKLTGPERRKVISILKNNSTVISPESIYSRFMLSVEEQSDEGFFT